MNWTNLLKNNLRIRNENDECYYSKLDLTGVKLIELDELTFKIKIFKYLNLQNNQLINLINV